MLSIFITYALLVLIPTLVILGILGAGAFVVSFVPNESYPRLKAIVISIIVTTYLAWAGAVRQLYDQPNSIFTAVLIVMCALLLGGIYHSLKVIWVVLRRRKD